MKVLITGGSGLVGQAIQQLKPSLTNENWIYLSSKDCDLNDFQKVRETLENYQPDIIIHLAANVGGLFKNAANRLAMFNTNLQINYNVLENAYQLGIKRVICCLSTCIFPDGLNRVLTEKDLHLGEPHHSNYGYAYAKRIMEVQCRLYNETPGFHYQCIIPTNIYGPYDNFHIGDSHVIPGLIHKAFLHSQLGLDRPFEILGTGMPRRQFIYVGDLAKIIVRLVEDTILEPLLICSTPVETETNILSVAKLIALEFDIHNVMPTEKSDKKDGQQIKTASPQKLLDLMPGFQFIPLDQGIHKTVQWFKENYPNIRK